MPNKRPHSLGQSVEWKLALMKRDRCLTIAGPTRWGNQLNGNWLTTIVIFLGIVGTVGAPLAGAIS